MNNSPASQKIVKNAPYVTTLNTKNIKISPKTKPFYSCLQMKIIFERNIHTLMQHGVYFCVYRKEKKRISLFQKKIKKKNAECLDLFTNAMYLINL